MPSTIIVNRMTTQHKSSVGIASAFPDVCKTPVPPAPSPIPIPYPNIAMSAMASLKTTKRVKDNKQKVVVKGSAYSLSNGDQPGVAMGVVSNKIMGKSYIKNQSFNVKFEKKGVGRLMDPHGNNSGSNPNGIAPAQGQPPNVASTDLAAAEEACKGLAGKQIPEEDLDKAYRDHGIHPEHGKKMRAYSTSTDGPCISVREGNVDCIDKINMGFGGKPGACGGDSISRTDTRNLPECCRGLIGEPVRDAAGNKVSGADWAGLSTSKRGEHGYIPSVEVKEVLEERGEDGLMKWLQDEGALTGDYDLHDTFDSTGARIPDGTEAELDMEIGLNDALGTSEGGKEMIQHGAQSNCSDYFEHNKDEMAKKKAKFGEEKFDRIQRPDPWDKCGDDPPDYRKKGKPVMHFDSNGEVYMIEDHEDVAKLYKCKNNGNDLPEKWQDHDAWEKTLKECADKKRKEALEALR